MTNDLTVFRTAKSPLEAELIAGILRDHGIPTFIDGTLLADEFALSQRLLGASAVKVQIPRMHLPAAEAALAAARESSDMVDAEAAALARAPNTERALEPPRSNPRAWILPVVLAVCAALLFCVWMTLRANLRHIEQGALFTFDTDSKETESIHRWNDSRAVASRQVDNDRNGIPELSDWHHRDGRLRTRNYDQDQNGVPEKIAAYDSRGEVATVSHDDDQNGVYERTEERRAGGRVVMWHDSDQDGRVDRVEQREANGTISRAWTWHDERGFEPAR